MEYKVVQRTLVDDGKNPYWQLVLWGDLPKKVGNISTEEIRIVRSKDEGDLLAVGSTLHLLATHEPIPESLTNG